MSEGTSNIFERQVLSLAEAAQLVLDEWRKHGASKVPAYALIKLQEALDKDSPMPLLQPGDGSKE